MTKQIHKQHEYSSKPLKNIQCPAGSHINIHLKNTDYVPFDLVHHHIPSFTVKINILLKYTKYKIRHIH